MKEFTFHYITGKQLVFSLTTEEYQYLESCLDTPVQWFRLAEQAINLDLVTLIEAS